MIGKFIDSGPMILGFGPCSRQITVHSIDCGKSLPLASEQVGSVDSCSYAQIMLACTSAGTQVWLDMTGHNHSLFFECMGDCYNKLLYQILT